MKTITDVIAARNYRTACKQAELALEKYRSTCKDIATGVVQGMLGKMAESDDETYVLILGTDHYIFCSKDVALANQGVETALKFPQKPEMPTPPQPEDCVELLSTKHLAHSEWQYIKEAMKEAQISAKEIRIFGDYLVFIISLK